VCAGAAGPRRDSTLTWSTPHLIVAAALEKGGVIAVLCCSGGRACVQVLASAGPVRRTSTGQHLLPPPTAHAAAPARRLGRGRSSGRSPTVVTTAPSLAASRTEPTHRWGGHRCGIVRCGGEWPVRPPGGDRTVVERVTVSDASTLRGLGDGSRTLNRSSNSGSGSRARPQVEIQL